MKTYFASLSVAFALTLGLSFDASASFVGYYGVSNWTLTDTAGGSVDTSAAPDSISLSSGNSGSLLTETPAPGDTFFTISAQTQSLVSFSWSYFTNDLFGYAGNDFFGYVINGNVSVLPDQSRAPTDPTPADPTGTLQTGTVAFFVNAGDVFGFNANTFDGFLGSSVGTVSNFSVTAVPLPAAVWLLGSALAGLAGIARRHSV